MTVKLAESILEQLQPEIKIAYMHRFAGDRGTIIRLDNYAMINIFDDGRYYVQGSNTAAVSALFSQVEKPWDPDSWEGQGSETVLPWFPPKGPENRLGS